VLDAFKSALDASFGRVAVVGRRLLESRPSDVMVSVVAF
jgi:hypothetical protein